MKSLLHQDISDDSTITSMHSRYLYYSQYSISIIARLIQYLSYIYTYIMTISQTYMCNTSITSRHTQYLYNSHLPQSRQTNTMILLQRDPLISELYITLEIVVIFFLQYIVYFFNNYFTLLYLHAHFFQILILDIKSVTGALSFYDLFLFR